MKKQKAIMVAIFTDFVANLIVYYIFSTPKLQDMSTVALILIVSFVICGLISIGFIILWDKLQRFNHAIIDNIYAQANLNQDILAKPENADICDKYYNSLDAIKRYRPYNQSELNDLYIFDPKNPHKANNQNA
jgi:hypothetical protein